MHRYMRNYIEAELRAYEWNKRRLEALREEIIESGCAICYEQTGTGGGEIAKPTEQKVIKLMTSPEIKRLTEVIDAIDEGLKDLDPHHQKLFDLRYKKKKGIVETCNELSCAERTYRRWNKQIFKAIGFYLGME